MRPQTHTQTLCETQQPGCECWRCWVWYGTVQYGMGSMYARDVLPSPSTDKKQLQACSRAPCVCPLLSFLPRRMQGRYMYAYVPQVSRRCKGLLTRRFTAAGCRRATRQCAIQRCVTFSLHEKKKHSMESANKEPGKRGARLSYFHPSRRGYGLCIAVHPAPAPACAIVQ